MIWYSIDIRDNDKFEAFANSLFPEERKRCDQYIRHKNILIHPGVLIKMGIRVYKAIQYPWEYIVTKAASYHCGFDTGFNISEQVNFALPSWIEHGKRAKPCMCNGAANAIKLDMNLFINNLQNNTEKGAFGGLIGQPAPSRSMFKSSQSFVSEGRQIILERRSDSQSRLSAERRSTTIQDGNKSEKNEGLVIQPMRSSEFKAPFQKEQTTAKLAKQPVTV